MNEEKLFYFVKPHVVVPQQRVIADAFLTRLENRAHFMVLGKGETKELPEEFWQGHYGYIAQIDPAWKDLKRMIFDFSYVYGRGINWGVLAGEEGLTARAREVLGNKRWSEAKPGTIRRDFMKPEGISYNTVMHVSDLERVDEEIANAVNFGLFS